MSPQTIPVQVLVDSGADDNFIDSNLVKLQDLALVELLAPKKILAIDSSLLKVVTHKTEPVKLTVSGNHCLLSAVPEKTPITPDPPEEIDLPNVSREYH